jgi:hypothetical protein
LTIAIFEKSKVITELLNGAHVALQAIMPLDYQLNKPTVAFENLEELESILLLD